jgi:hypothetical protein
MARAVPTLALVLVLTGSAPAAPSGPSGMLTVTGTVLVPDEAEGPGKKFRGVLLEEPGGQRWVLAYQRDFLWESFKGRSVVVTGERDEPKGQALALPHLKPHAWKAADPKQIATFIEVGPEEKLSGRFRESTWPKGTKLEGEKELHFTTDSGRSFHVVNRPPGVVLDQPRKISARAVVHSPFVAHLGGDTLYVLAIATK